MSVEAHEYTEEEISFIKEYVPGHTRKEFMEAFKDRFGWELTIGQLKGRMVKYGLKTGNTGYFGTRPSHNKGQKLSPEKYERIKATMFKKGNLPRNTAPIGAEVLRYDGYMQVKVANPNKWKFKHILVWEAANGPVPPKNCVMFLDRNKQNCDLSNLRLVSRAAVNVINRNRMFTEDPKINETLIALAEYMAAAKIGTLDALEHNRKARAKRKIQDKRGK